jgi:hypothetical protein
LHCQGLLWSKIPLLLNAKETYYESYCFLEEIGMFISAGAQTQINTTTDLDQLLVNMLVAPNGTRYAVYESTTLNLTGATFHSAQLSLRGLDAAGNPSGYGDSGYGDRILIA